MGFLDILAILIQGTLLASTPLILTALGGIFSERSGVINIALEGLMLFGAFTGVTLTLLMQNTWGEVTPWLAIIIAGAISAIFSLVHAVATITLKANQTVTGVAINILATGLSVFMVNQIFGRGQTEFISVRINRINIPVLSDIPIIGDLFFSQVAITSYIAIVLVFVVWYVLFKTPFGLQLRAVGEHPAAADTMGINVYKMRYVAVVLSGLFAGVGGAVFGLSISGNFSAMTISGHGFLAMAAMIFGKWNPLGTLGAALFFGFAQSLGLIGGSIPIVRNIPSIILITLPYFLTVLALVGFVGRADAPKALGKPYEKGKR